MDRYVKSSEDIIFKINSSIEQSEYVIVLQLNQLLLMSDDLICVSVSWVWDLVTWVLCAPWVTLSLSLTLLLLTHNQLLWNWLWYPKRWNLLQHFNSEINWICNLSSALLYKCCFVIYPSILKIRHLLWRNLYLKNRIDHKGNSSVQNNDSYQLKMLLLHNDNV